MGQVISDETRRRVAERAYARFLARGGAHGHDLEDWLAAEAELDDARVDEADRESFPASDPPAWTVSHVGPPAR